MNKRLFLQALGAGGLGVSGLGGWLSSVQAQGVNDYKALVCIYLFGGNDGHNTLVPYEAATHAEYLALRPEYSARTDAGLGVPHGALLPLGVGGGGAASWGLHPALPQMHARWARGQVAWLQNVGTLVEPVTRSSFFSRQKPAALGSHNDQQEISMLATQDPQGVGAEQGWGSRLWQQWAQGSPAHDMAQVTFGGNNRWMASPQLPTTALTPNATLRLDWPLHMAPVIAQGRQSARPFTRAYAETMARAYQQGAAVNAVFNNTGGVAHQAFLSAAGGTAAAASFVHQQLLAVARFIEARTQLGAPGRQLFFVTAGGYDTHAKQYATHAGLLGNLDAALHAFMSTVDSLGLSNQVTAFSMSDFGRTLRMNGSQGTDHAWSSHAFVMGGAVNGGLYGRAANLAPTSADVRPDDINSVIPSASINQYGATLASWMGLNSTQLAAVFPDLRNFSSPNLGFMRA